MLKVLIIKNKCVKIYINILLKYKKMIFDFLKKQTDLQKKIKLTKVMLLNLQIPEEQKSLYIQALDILDEEWIDRIYISLSSFVEDIEIRELWDISKENFSVINWMKKKEAEERKKEINSFSFLINNL